MRPFAAREPQAPQEGEHGRKQQATFRRRAGALAAAATVRSVDQAAASTAEETRSGTAPVDKHAFRPPAGPRYRVISDNDYSGDPDGLFQLVHMLLSPSLDVRAVIGSHLAVGDSLDSSTRQAANAVARAETVLRLMGLRGGCGSSKDPTSG